VPDEYDLIFAVYQLVSLGVDYKDALDNWTLEDARIWFSLSTYDAWSMDPKHRRK